MALALGERHFTVMYFKMLLFVTLVFNSADVFTYGFICCTRGFCKGVRLSDLSEHSCARMRIREQEFSELLEQCREQTGY